ncbi:MAG: c-type cytochrome [Gemmatimonadales bacterium]
MTRRTAGILALASLPVLAAAFGGWATITVNDLPDHLVAGRPASLAFMVRQHGVSPMTGLKPTVLARAGREETRATVAPGRKAGEYVASFTLPQAGDWTVSIASGFGKSNLKLLPIRAIDAGARAAAPGPADRGMRLFVAKGCVGCHVHRVVASDDQPEIGPNLTGRRYQPDYLAKFLNDPRIGGPSRRSKDDPYMPDLDLSDAEISALIVFLNSEQRVEAKR